LDASYWRIPSKSAAVAAAAVLLFVWTPAASAASHYVAAGGDLQAAIDAAQPGDEILLERGGRYVGPFRLPAKPAGAAITIKCASNGPERRIRWPEDGPLLPIIVSGTVDPAISGYDVANWRFEVLRFDSNVFGQGNIIELHNVANISMDRLVILGGREGQKRAILANGRHITLTRSHIENIWQAGTETHAFLAYDGAGPYTIVDNYLEAAGINIMFGGADSSAPDRIPADILVEANHITKRHEWRGQARGVKNLFELKSAKRVTVRNNLFENNWSDAQAGWSIVFTPRNQDGRSPWSVVEDVLFERNVVRDVERGVNLTGYDYLHPSNQAARITIRRNIFVTSFNFLQAAGEISDLTIDHNTVHNAGPFIFLYTGDLWSASTGPRPAAVAVQRLVVTNNLAYGNNGGLGGDGATGGTFSLQLYAPGYVWTHNVLAGGQGTYPPFTFFPTIQEYEAQFVPGTYTLKASSDYTTAANDGSTLGAPSNLGIKAPGRLRLTIAQ
jgi:hypothetical protein